MKKIFFLLLGLCSFYYSKAEPVLEEGKVYLITLGRTSGALHVGNETFPIGFTPGQFDPKVLSNAFHWRIRRVAHDLYSIQNVSNNRYVRYDRSKPDRNSLVFSDRQHSDQSTLFHIIPVERAGVVYYAIRPASYTGCIWNRRNNQHGEAFFPVGTYGRSIKDPTDNELFLFMNSDGTNVRHNRKNTEKRQKSSLGALNIYLEYLTFDGKAPAYNLRSDELIYTVSDKLLNKDLTMTVSYYSPQINDYRIYINGKEIKSGDDAVFEGLSCLKTYSLELRERDMGLVKTKIRFTTFPIVQLYSSRSLSSTYKSGSITVTESDKDTTGQNLNAHLRFRGATALTMPKKSYAVKLTKEDGVTPLNESFLGLRSDNDWILDAAYIDPSRCRNRIATDLWLDYSTPPYYAEQEPKAINGARGGFVELLFNDRYDGLYVMTEKVDRKQLDLKKIISKDTLPAIIQKGALYKAVNWSPATLMGQQRSENKTIPLYDNGLEKWASFEVKYPDFDESDPVDWKPLYNAVLKSSYSSSKKEFGDSIAYCFDLPVFRDYYLLLDLILATDNQGKNIFLSVYDQTKSSMLTITPWDLDGTWGRNWSGSNYSTPPNLSFFDYCNRQSEGMNVLFLRLALLNVDQWNFRLAERYRKLRAGYFAYESLIGRFDRVFEAMSQSGAMEREQALWNGSSINNELNYLRSWIKARLDFLDRQYLGMPYTSELNNPNLNSLFTAFYQPINKNIYVSGATQGTTLKVINAKGRAVSTVTVDTTGCVIDGSSLSSGTYTLKGNHHFVKIIVP